MVLEALNYNKSSLVANLTPSNQCLLMWQNGARFRSFILNFFNLAKTKDFLSYMLTRISTSHENRELEDRQFNP
jgi:hypothetical protein